MSVNLRVLGGVIRNERLRRQLSQEGLAELAGVGRTQIGDVERGVTNISFANLAAIADGLKIPLSEIIAQYEKQLLTHQRQSRAESS